MKTKRFTWLTEPPLSPARLIGCLVLFMSPFFVNAQRGVKPNSVGTAEYMYVMPSLQERLDEGTYIIPVAKNKVVNPRRGTASSVNNPKALPLDGDPLAKSNRTENANMHQREPLLTFDALDNGNSSPTDPTGAVGPNHYVNAYNSGFRIYDREGAALVPHASLNTIWPNEDLGDPIVLYDRYVDRWFIAQFSNSPNGVLLAYSQGPDPVNDGWFTYRFNTGSFPDYPKFSIWSDGIYMTANKDQGSPATSDVVYVFERDDMIAGADQADVDFVAFSLPGIVNDGFYSPLPFHADGANGLPPVGTNNFIAYMQDDAWGGVANDHIKLWEVDMDWGNTNNSTISATPAEIGVDAFDGVFDNGSFSNLPQSSGNDIDALQATMMYMMPYYRFGNHNTVLMNWVVDLDGNDDFAGIRWVELRQDEDGGAWTVFQQGTHTIDDGDDVSRFCGSIGMDAQGNIGLAYTVVNTSTFPSLRYTGRMANDPPGQMTVTEEEHATGTAIDPTSRYGDYGQLVLDPTDDVTFWHIGEYFDGGRDNGVGVFRLAECLEDLVITAEVADGGIDHREAELTITASNIVNDGAEAIYHAGEEVLLLPGFVAAQGAIFRAYIEGCSGEFMRAVDPDTESIQARNRRSLEDFSEQKIVTNLEVFPNPTKGNFSLSLEGLDLENYTVQIYNMGKGMVFTNRIAGKGQNNLELDLANYPSGIYVVKVSDNKNIYTAKVVKID